MNAALGFKRYGIPRMEIIFIAVIVGAFYGGYKSGKEQGLKEIENTEQKDIMAAFSMKDYDSNNIFHKVYGVNGIRYFCVIDPSGFSSEISAPKVIIQSSDFERLIAIRNIAFDCDESGNLNDEEIEKHCVDIQEQYWHLLKLQKGWK